MDQIAMLINQWRKHCETVRERMKDSDKFNMRPNELHIPRSDGGWTQFDLNRSLTGIECCADGCHWSYHETPIA